MGDLWPDEGFGSAGADGGDDDWDEGEESLEGGLEDGFGVPVERDDEDGWEDDEA